ncbi:MAG TPA: glycerol-3-phosphate acyltransferase [Acidimicrobiia bacterium]
MRLVAAAVLGYLVGTFPSADVVCRIATRGRVDLRTVGSGNPGGLNAMKSIGTAWGVAVVVADMLKGVVAGFAGMAVGGDGGGYAAATASIAGHIFPVWSRFRGGKGVATSAGACLAVFPAFFPIDAAVAALGAAGTRHPERTIWGNGVAWIASALVWWLADLPNLWGPAPTWGLLAFTGVSSAMIVWKFRVAAVAARPVRIAA